MIHKGSNDSLVRSRDKVGLRLHNGHWLSMYSRTTGTYSRSCLSGHRSDMRSGGGRNGGHAMWSTGDCPGDPTNWPAHTYDLCENEIHYIYNVRDTERIYNRGDLSILENGDFVHIEWRGNCRSLRNDSQFCKGYLKDMCMKWYEVHAYLFGGPFEIVKVDHGTDMITETNNWDNVPRLPSRQYR